MKTESIQNKQIYFACKTIAAYAYFKFTAKWIIDDRLIIAKKISDELTTGSEIMVLIERRMFQNLFKNNFWIYILSLIEEQQKIQKDKELEQQLNILKKSFFEFNLTLN